MVRLLIAHSSELFTDMLVRRLQDSMEICVCHDGSRVPELLQSFQPEAMVLDLHLPRKDGLTILRQYSDLPRTILGTTGYCSLYMQRTAYMLGVNQLLLMPTASNLAASLASLLQQAQDPFCKPDIREQTRRFLQELNFSPHLDGYKQLSVALPLFAADPRQGLSKELYPAVAEILQSGDWRTVERSIRTAIRNAWLNRDPAVWTRYFPESVDCPNTKRFLCCLAERIEL